MERRAREAREDRKTSALTNFGPFPHLLQPATQAPPLAKSLGAGVHCSGREASPLSPSD